MWLMLLFILNANTQTNALQVIGGNRTVVQGRTVTFNCELVDTTETVNQISWQRTTRVKTDNFFLTVRKINGPEYVNGRDDRIKFIGSFNELNGSFQISSVSLQDEGIYTCIFTLFPSGTHNTHIHLDVLVPPVIRVEDNLPTLADKEVCIATCTAAGSKPPANVSWLTDSLADNLRETANSTHHDDGKTTTVSYLFGVPAMEIDQQVVHCVITSPALSKEAKVPFTIQVYFAPKEVKIGANLKEDSFQCETDSKPKPEFNWTRVGKAWPQSGVRVEGGTLQFLTRSSDLNGLYQCTAFNPYGRSIVYIFRSVISEPCVVCWILFAILIVLIVAAAVWHLYKSGKLPFFLVTRREAEMTNPEETAFKEDRREAE
ncbi:nectin-4-like isoform X1 [Platichthys flesus]|uniref:nectin-4-like isoform X1 n=1 Tax=Platichthys flesus TaxID=8260 RepID=UPI002DB9E29E|nr:nectin-4-like isoform X1 [Platichthys flesus]XP_062258716.1 nectin-4-like isoform X1 [Platichthys flesus]